MKEINGYELSRAWFNWCFENPEKISPNHTALYFFMIEHCNRLGWKKKFGFPTSMAMEAIGIKSYNTYIKTLRDLVAFGFVEMIEVSKNQYSSNIIALSKFNNAPNKALDKALIKHTSKQRESTGESIDSIDKQVTSKPITNTPIFPKEKTIATPVKISHVDVEEVYKKYPTKCLIRGASTGKGAKDKTKIKALLKQHSKNELLETIELYVNDCVSTSTYMKNFSTFLNNLPSIESFEGSNSNYINNNNNGNNQITAKERQRQNVTIEVGRGILQDIYDEQNQ